MRNTWLFVALVAVGFSTIPAVLTASPASRLALRAASPAAQSGQPEQQSDVPPKSATHVKRSPAQTYAGRIISRRGQLILMNDAGPGIYRLDDQAKASKYKGKHVIVTGSLNAADNTIHVIYIEPGDNSTKTKRGK
jgi:Protein of unknown function (DUF5818)